MVVLNAGPTTMTAHARGRMAFFDVVCCPSLTRVAIWDRRSFGQEEEDEDDNGDNL